MVGWTCGASRLRDVQYGRANDGRPVLCDPKVHRPVDLHLRASDRDGARTVQYFTAAITHEDEVLPEELEPPIDVPNLRMAATEETLTIEPPPAEPRCGMENRLINITLFRSVAITRSHRVVSMVTSEPPEDMPASLIGMSSFP